jgi:hypothetical protein
MKARNAVAAALLAFASIGVTTAQAQAQQSRQQTINNIKQAQSALAPRHDWVKVDYSGDQTTLVDRTSIRRFHEIRAAWVSTYHDSPQPFGRSGGYYDHIVSKVIVNCNTSSMDTDSAWFYQPDGRVLTSVRAQDIAPGINGEVAPGSVGEVVLDYICSK